MLSWIVTPAMHNGGLVGQAAPGFLEKSEGKTAFGSCMPLSLGVFVTINAE